MDPTEPGEDGDGAPAMGRQLTFGALVNLLTKVLRHDVGLSGLPEEEYMLVRTLEAFIDERIRHDREDR